MIKFKYVFSIFLCPFGPDFYVCISRSDPLYPCCTSCMPQTRPKTRWSCPRRRDSLVVSDYFEPLAGRVRPFSAAWSHVTFSSLLMISSPNVSFCMIGPEKCTWETDRASGNSQSPANLHRSRSSWSPRTSRNSESFGSVHQRRKWISLTPISKSSLSYDSPNSL